MKASTLEKQQALINHFGSVEMYQKNIFHKVPPLFQMICDEDGNVEIDSESVGIYLNKEMSESNLSFEEICERDSKIFSTIIDEVYAQTFNQ
jgi:hypothetical protein